MNKTQILEKLEQIRNKGAAWQTAERAQRMLQELKPFLESHDHFNIHLGIVHFKLGEGSVEFYDEIGKVIKKYKVC